MEQQAFDYKVVKKTIPPDGLMARELHSSCAAAKYPLSPQDSRWGKRKEALR
jgi:hypothetical protein